VIDIGTGDGRFVSAAARTNPDKFFIGIDANVKPLEKTSMKATRKPAKGGLPNALFVQASVEDLPEELTGTASDIRINFPWGSLLRAVLAADEAVVASLKRIAKPECVIQLVIGIDLMRDSAEIERLRLPAISDEYLMHELPNQFGKSGFTFIGGKILERSEWSKLETTWARKLQTSLSRKVVYLSFRLP